MQTYTPQRYQKPPNLVPVPSAWKGLESVLGDILDYFQVGRDNALEFGVEYGYSTVAISNFFTKTVGVDTFKGDENTSERDIDGLYEAVKELVAPYPIELVQTSYQEYTKSNHGHFDLIHIDIVHTYQDTFDCGEWALKHADMVIFHDTESFPMVKKAVSDLASKHGIEFYNYPFHNGLGILCRRG